jgi:glycosyltransferase involved in cell wall biosynthesis
VQIALDATYSLGENLSGVGVYSRKIMFGLAQAHPEDRFLYCYRPHKLLKSLKESLPSNARRRILRGAPTADVFHAVNQRVHERGRATVTTFHDLFVMTGQYSSPEFRARFTAQAKEAADRSDRIIAVSEFTAHQVEQLLQVPRDRIHVIHHGVDLPSPANVAREKMVLFVGAIQRRKNVARLVRAFDAMPSGWKLVLAGAAAGWGAEEELRAVQESSRTEEIRVAGYVSAAELEALYRRASIFAFPSLDEGFGMPVLEAMAHGVPVLTSTRSALPEVAGGAALLADPMRVDEIAEGLRKLAADEALREQLIQRGLVRARESSWGRAVERTWEVYRLLV